jgi:hypothetical protein
MSLTSITRVKLSDLPGVGKYRGVMIYLYQKWFSFVVGDVDLTLLSEEELEEQEKESEVKISIHDTHEEATKAIKVKNAMNLPVYNGDGKKVTITGVHGRLLHAITKPKVEKEDDRSFCEGYLSAEYLFPIERWVADAIREELALRKRLKDLDEALKMIRVEHHGMRDGSGQRVYFAHYDSDIDDCAKGLKSRYAEKNKIAKKFSNLDEAIKYIHRERERKQVERTCVRRSVGLR